MTRSIGFETPSPTKVLMVARSSGAFPSSCKTLATAACRSGALSISVPSRSKMTLAIKIIPRTLMVGRSGQQGRVAAIYPQSNFTSRWMVWPIGGVEAVHDDGPVGRFYQVSNLAAKELAVANAAGNQPLRLLVGHGHVLWAQSDALAFGRRPGHRQVVAALGNEDSLLQVACESVRRSQTARDEAIGGIVVEFLR